MFTGVLAAKPKTTTRVTRNLSGAAMHLSVKVRGRTSILCKLLVLFTQPKPNALKKMQGKHICQFSKVVCRQEAFGQLCLGPSLFLCLQPLVAKHGRLSPFIWQRRQFQIVGKSTKKEINYHDFAPLWRSKHQVRNVRRSVSSQA